MQSADQMGSGSGKSNYPSRSRVLLLHAVGTLILICQAAAKKEKSCRHANPKLLKLC